MDLITVYFPAWCVIKFKIDQIVASVLYQIPGSWIGGCFQLLFCLPSFPLIKFVLSLICLIYYAIQKYNFIIIAPRSLRGDVSFDWI